MSITSSSLESAHRRVSLWLLACWIAVTLVCPATASPQLDAFEAALDGYRFQEAGRLLQRIPAGPEKLLAQAELAQATQHPEETYVVTDQIVTEHLLLDC